MLSGQRELLDSIPSPEGNRPAGSLYFSWRGEERKAKLWEWQSDGCNGPRCYGETARAENGARQPANSASCCRAGERASLEAPAAGLGTSQLSETKDSQGERRVTELSGLLWSWVLANRILNSAISQVYDHPSVYYSNYIRMFRVSSQF